MIGDVVAKPGRIALLERIQDLQENYGIDFTIVNGENVAGGFSITEPFAEQFFAHKVDVITSGNHIFDKREIVSYISKQPRLLRPANFPAGTPGAGLWTGTAKNGTPVAVMNLIGRVFMHPVDDPFRRGDELIASLTPETKIRIVDFHAEATSEKMAMGWHLDGRVSAVLGTHTHVQTADERILPGGTSYLTDLGMTGSHAGVIGMDRADVLARFTSVTARRAEHATGDVRIHGVVLDIDEETGRAREISRISLAHQS